MKLSFRTLTTLTILAQLGLAACVNTEREAATSSKEPRGDFTPPSGRGQRVGGATVLNTVRATHAFSDPKSPDTFVLQMRGPRILTSQLHLFVISSQGDTLRHEVLPARLLLDDPTLRDNQSASTRDKEISILRGMNAFFKPDHFVQPAVPTSATQPAELDTQTWASLRNDPRAVGFNYPSASGTSRLAYSRQLRRAILLNE
ncbi:hypothetical protein GO988_04455 [Hymenobacter sp. HMF4947]|uniref:Uncharacterized protein n=1 Tax=Hymenobacter ginkgonis TaxID=2682976 RepID=A0A7K1TBL5_9BACT|nr:hypothetical protein [Hymenobacter ginkgonis]MVN75571.1 hypothetical protein [Hymenobacter ginkgonis]